MQSSSGFDHNLIYIYDLETYPNCFLFSGKWRGSQTCDTFEISFRRNDKDALLKHLSYLQGKGVYLTGFNNLGFDYPIIHDLLGNPFLFDATRAHQKATEIIHGQHASYGREMIHHRDRLIPQIDLMKINHFDNPSRRTSLKVLEFAMRLHSVEDLPFPLGDLTSEQIDTLIKYNHYDLYATEMFYEKCKHLVEMRWDLLASGAIGGDVLNYSDVKLGEKYLITKLGRNNCYKGSKPIQTKRTEIRFKDIILNKIFFKTEKFQEVLEWFKKQVHYVYSEDESFSHSARLAGLDFYFGVGGVHASVESKYFESNSTHAIIDVDVTAMYPSIAVANGFHPEHLGTKFLEVYSQLQKDRRQHKKGTPMNALLKLANNGVFGKGDSEFSCFYDPRFPKQITVNGQLQILQLVESLSLIPGVQIIQANTDGVTCYVPRDMLTWFNTWKTDWERETLLSLEEVHFKKMWIRDVNNYLVLKEDGTVKRKGAYWYPEQDKDYDGFWNKDYSRMITEKAIEQVLINGFNIDNYLKIATNPYDFMLRYKTPAGAKVYIGDKECSKTVRYYISKLGQPMKKVAKDKGEIGAYKRRNGLKDSEFNKILATIPAGTWDERIHTKNKSKYGIRETEIEKGFLVKECNNAQEFKWEDVDFDYYRQEIEKLVIR